MRKLSISVMATLAIAMTVACQSTPNNGETIEVAEESVEIDPRRGDEVDRICFSSGIRGFGKATKNTVIVNKSASKQYQLEVFQGCQNLRHAESLAFDTTSSCVTRGDKILAFSSFTGPSRNDFPSFPCSITKMYEWNKDAGKEEASKDAPELEDAPEA